MSASDKPVAFIPARGGSQRLPRKALAELGGRPLLAWTIQPALEAECFAEVVVSSDDAEICDVARTWGATVHVRPPELAGDEVTLDQVLRAFGPPGLEPIAVLLPTVPFRHPGTIRRAVELFQRRRGAELWSVTPYAHPPQWALIRHGVTLTPAYPALWPQARQRLTPAWQHDGSYRILGGPGREWYAFETPRLEVCDINTPEDLEYARWMLPRRVANAAAI